MRTFTVSVVVFLGIGWLPSSTENLSLWYLPVVVILVIGIVAGSGMAIAQDIKELEKY